MKYVLLSRAGIGSNIDLFSEQNGLKLGHIVVQRLFYRGRGVLMKASRGKIFFSATFQRRYPILECGSCTPCVNISNLYTSRKHKLIELLSHASNHPKHCIKTNLNIVKIFLPHFIANTQS